MRKQSATIGRNFGRLTVTDRAPDRGTDKMFQCSCSCGNHTVVSKSHLYGGRQKSCGCLRREITVARNTTHGHSAGKKTTAEFRAWCSMKARCLNENHEKFPIYGGRGIYVDPSWVEDFSAFLAHVGPKPKPSMSIDRIDVNGSYTPGNVRWATPHQQRVNQRRMMGQGD